MALRFDSAGTCLIVRQYLERSKNILRSDLGEKIQLLFSHEAESGESKGKSGKATSLADAKANATEDNSITV